MNEDLKNAKSLGILEFCKRIKFFINVKFEIWNWKKLNFLLNFFDLRSNDTLCWRENPPDVF